MAWTVTAQCELDNRDPGTTELVVSSLRISVNPRELFANMIENNFPTDPTDIPRAEYERNMKIERLWEELSKLIQE
jgi:hypothetical protein